MRFALVFATPAVLIAGLRLGGAWTFLPVALIFVVLPILDEAVGSDTGPSPGARWFADAPLYLWALVQIGVLGFALHETALGLTRLEFAGLALSLGVMNGAGGITVAHELMHRASRRPRAVAEALMTSVSYTHFCIEHVHGHHRNVATPVDPASARLGETLFAFWRRSIVGGVRSAWRIESERVGRRELGLFGDRRLRHPVLLGLAYGAIGASFGARGLALFALQSAVAIGLLETVNYLEHYGLSRRETANGGFEPVLPRHSWNTSRALTNAYLFNLGRHSDHHATASRPYETLRHFDDVPQLPAGYSAMMLLALVPPLWFRVMNARVAPWRRPAL